MKNIVLHLFIFMMLSGCLALAVGCCRTAQKTDGMNIKSKEELIFPLGASNDAYAQYFSGQSYLAPLAGGYHNVTFAPGCRNNWHIHHGAVQVLICVAGHGWYQEWDKPAVELKPGVIIEVPEGVKHWHGAAKDSWMQHLYLHKDEQEGASNEWCEPVSDEAYAEL